MKKITGFLITLLLTLSGGFGQVALDSATLAKVNKSVFEVIVDKKDSSNIKYEKELPLDRIPFAIRNDKYTPIGTAFLLEDGSFWTAARIQTNGITGSRMLKKQNFLKTAMFIMVQWQDWIFSV